MSETFITDCLCARKDASYRIFLGRILPSLDLDVILGVRMPEVRKLARQWRDTPTASVFLSNLPHSYFDENNLHAALIEHIQDFDVCARSVDAFLPYIDNWATCDMLSPSVFRRKAEYLIPWIERWMSSKHVYTIRFGLEMLMKHFLDERFDDCYLCMAAEITSQEYYVRMMVSWFFATALAKQYEATLPYFIAPPI